MRARILKPTPENLALAAEALTRGEVVAIPTETVYGLAGAALDENALATIFEKKERPVFDPLIVHVGALGKGLFQLTRLELIDMSKLSPLACERAEKLIAAFWPGPLTLVLPKNQKVPDLATSGLSTVGIRMPKHSVAQALLALTNTPLAAPSANRFGRISPTTAEAVAEELGDRIDLIIDGGPCEVGVESTVISVHPAGELTLLRPGGISATEIARVAGVALTANSSTGPHASPGMLESHYAPGKALKLLSTPVELLGEEDVATLAIPRGASVGLLVMSGNADDAATQFARMSGCSVNAISLSANGDTREMAHSLFAALRTLDASEASLLIAERCQTEEGLGHAINDRLKRASSELKHQA
jgi:L-threonylcarbamoyladenylate synthase